MNSKDLDRLERQLDALIKSHDRQKRETSSLREKQASLLIERDDLHNKLELAIKGIKKVVKRLKEIESEEIHARTQH